MAAFRAMFISPTAVFVVGLALVLSAGFGCQNRKTKLRGLVAEQQATLCWSLAWFREASIIVPKGGTVADVDEYFVSLGIHDDVSTAVKNHGLDLEDLDENELVLFLFSGLMQSRDHGDLEWLPIYEIIHRPFSQFHVFDPDPRWITDGDGDGWPEYSLPEAKPIRFCRESFDFPFSADFRRKKGGVMGR